MKDLSKNQKRKARVLALQTLYSFEHNKNNTIEEVFGSLSSIPEMAVASNDTRLFAKKLCLLAYKHMQAIDAILSEYTDNWEFDRLSYIDRNMLRVAAAEILSDCNTPQPVIINEAVEIVKAYGTDDSASFINGVIDAAKNKIKNITKE
ncbi:MAG: transcription antitermination factor NusB [Fibrobacterota bacterium]